MKSIYFQKLKNYVRSCTHFAPLFFPVVFPFSATFSVWSDSIWQLITLITRVLFVSPPGTEHKQLAHTYLQFHSRAQNYQFSLLDLTDLRRREDRRERDNFGEENTWRKEEGSLESEIVVGGADETEREHLGDFAVLAAATGRRVTQEVWKNGMNGWNWILAHFGSLCI